MAISRRHLLTGSSLIGPLATHAQASSWEFQNFNPTMVRALLSHTVDVANILAQDSLSDPRPFAATHAIAELAFMHFEETGFGRMIDRHLDRFVPHTPPSAEVLSATMRKIGMRLPEDVFIQMMKPDQAAILQAQQMGWSGLRALLLRGFEVGMTTLTAPRKMRTRAFWEPPWPRIVRKPLLLKNPHLAEELPRVQAAARVAITLGVALGGLTGTEANRGAGSGAAQMTSVVGSSAISTGIAVFLICSQTKKRLVASQSSLPTES